jgi:DNA-binding MarR family transcriptional regulator
LKDASQLLGRPRQNVAKRYVLEDQAGFLLRQVTQRHLLIFSDGLGADITPTQFSALVKLYPDQTLSQNLLGRVTAMDAATIKGVVDRLLRRGLIEVRPDPHDARLRLIALTGEGRALIESLIPAALRITEETLAPLSAEERVVFLEMLRKLC